MSFELSPETLIFSLQSQIPSLLQQITDLEHNIVELPETKFRTEEVRNNQGFFDGSTTQNLIFNPSLSGRQRCNTELQDKIRQFQE